MVSKISKEETALPLEDAFLPLLDLLERLASGALDETNAASLDFLEHLSAIEKRVALGNADTQEALSELHDVDSMAEAHDADRRYLEGALSEAISFGASVRAEIMAAREAMQTIAVAVGEMQNEVVQISRISREINILAVNATIESARAGDAGRGFAVISGAVRNLANATQQITHRLAPLVKGVHEELTKHGGATADGNAGPRTQDISQKLGDQGALLSHLGTKLTTLSRD